MRRIASLLLLACLVLALPALAERPMRQQAARQQSAVQQALPAPAQAAPNAERRIALVIGNAAYPTAPLKNPVNDARDMASALRSLGFEVIARENASLAQMEGAVSEFWGKLKRGGSGLFYFAGHGLQVNGRNYLVPVDARLEAEQDAKYKCMDAGLVLGRMENAGNELNIIILDACRNNPFARSWRSADVGLAKMDAPRGSIIAYATAPDSVAADGTGKNGLYTERLLRAMRLQGEPVEMVFKRVRDEVMRATGDKQVPWESTSLRGEFYFRPGPVVPEPPAEALGGQEPAQTHLASASTSKEPPLPAEAHKAGETWRDPATGMEFLWVPGGTFDMGCGPWAEEECIKDNSIVHTVRLNGFWLGKHEVTNAEYRRLNPDHKSTGAKAPGLFGSSEKKHNADRQPVSDVSWAEAKGYALWLSQKGNGKFRLPTEAEWEYAARSGGKHELYAGGGKVDRDRLGWHEGNSGGSTHDVGTKAPNGLGLFDMSGNVIEWCEDVYSENAYASLPQDNPVNRRGGQEMVSRGGAWFFGPDLMSTVGRARCLPSVRAYFLGFRLVREP